MYQVIYGILLGAVGDLQLLLILIYDYIKCHSGQNRTTLILVIEKEILPGTKIMSDEWKPYKVL